MPNNTIADRWYSWFDTERVDGDGFLDTARTPRVCRADELVAHPCCWVVGPPWIGKSTAAEQLAARLRRAAPVGLGFGSLVTRTTCGDGALVPHWWDAWAASRPTPAAWLVDGLDEIDSRSGALDQLADRIAALGNEHLEALRLVLFSRPYDELSTLRDRLDERYRAVTGVPRVPRAWLARLDRAGASALVGPERLARVCELVAANGLQRLVGYPIVLTHLDRCATSGPLTVGDVWRGVLESLLGVPGSGAGARFETPLAERFAGAARAAAVMVLTSRDALAEWEPDSDAPALDALYREPRGARLAAVREACRSALFVRAGDPPAYRFAQRSARDWLTAFALAPLAPASLRGALAGADGTLRPSLREPARLLRALNPAGATARLIDELSGGVALPSDAAEPALADALGVLDQLEALAARAPWGLAVRGSYQDELERLRADGLGPALAARLRDPARPTTVKHLLLDVAQATRATEVADAALELVLDAEGDANLRYAAAWLVTRLGGTAHLLALAEPIGEGAGGDETAQRLRGVVVRELLAQNLWPVWRAALAAPRPERGLIDSRTLVLGALEERMTLDDARRLLPHLGTLHARHAPEHRAHELPAFLSRALDLILGENPPAPPDLSALLAFVRQARESGGLGWLTARTVAWRAARVPAARYELYREAVAACDARGGLNPWLLLEPDDWRWLRDRLTGEWAGNRVVWEHCLHLAERAREDGRATPAEWDALVARAEACAPGLPAERAAARTRFEAERAAEAAERAAEEAQAPRPALVDRLEQLLGAPDVSSDGRMRGLAWACFGDTLSGAAEGAGWDDLPAELRARVLDALSEGLACGSPTPIPNAGPFPGIVLAEGEAFAAIAALAPARLTADLVRAWLPTALFARMSGDWDGPVTACAAAQPDATRAALVATMDQHVRTDARAFVLRQIPASAWTPELTERLAFHAHSSAVGAVGRAELLDQLAERAPDRAVALAAEWAARPHEAGDGDHLRRAGLNAQLTREPAAALATIETEYERRGTAALEELDALAGDSEDPDVRPERWPLEPLARLTALLLRAYPCATDPTFEDGFVPPHQTLRWLRGRLVNALFERTDPRAATLLDTAVEADPQARDHVATLRAAARAAVVLGHTGRTSPAPDALTGRVARDLLERADYRLVRTPADLLDALLDALRAIEADAGHDLPMLYHPAAAAPKPSPGTAPTSPAKRRRVARPPKRLRESALQAYLRRRLTDELGRIADGVAVQILREDEIARRQRLDLRVTAPAHGGTGLVTVVIEVKWSDNDEAVSGLVEQLGTRYLLGEHLTHGAFVVGWCGRWPAGSASGAGRDITALRSRLTDVRDRFRAGAGSGLCIEPVVLNLDWARTVG